MILEGPKDTKQLPEKSLGSIFYNALRNWDDNRVAIIDISDKEINFKSFLSLTVKVAKKLQNLGVKEGDVVTIISQNKWKYLATIVGCFYVGATVNLLNHDYTSGELKHFLSVCKPVVIFCSSKTLKNILPLQNEAFFPTKIINYDDDENPSALYFEDFVSDVDNNENFSPVDLNPKESVAFILTSSGTTGLPKCVQLTHANFRITLLYAHDPRFIDVNEKDSLVGFLPLFHIFGSAVALTSVLVGAKFSILDKFIPDQFLQLIQDQKVSKLLVVPPVLVFLVKHPLVAKYDLSSVIDILAGAAPVSPEIEQLAEKKLKVTSIRQVYGMTEVGGGATIMPKGVKKYGSAGKVVISTLIKICDPESGKELPPQIVGELRIKGEGVMKGYLGNEIETANAFDEEGYIKSGDLGYYDEEGFIYIIDRLKELIKYKGFQVCPSELENLLLKHPKIKDAGVVGKQDERAGEVPVAFIVKQPEEALTEEEVANYVAENLSIQKHLYGGVKFVEEIPKNASGKILRRKLRELV